MSTHWWHGAASLRSGSFFALWALRVALLPRRQIPPLMWHALRVRAVARVFHPLMIPQGWSRSAVVVEGLLHTQLRVTLRVASVPNLVGKAPPQNQWTCCSLYYFQSCKEFIDAARAHVGESCSMPSSAVGSVGSDKGVVYCFLFIPPSVAWAAGLSRWGYPPPEPGPPP